jgi:hypothetical protein
MGVAYNGLDGTVVSQSTDMDVTGFSADVEAEEIDATTTADNGWEDAIYGSKKVSGTFDFLWNPAKNPFNAVIGMMPGNTSYPTLTLRLSSGETLSGLAMISKLSIKSAVKGQPKTFTATFRNKGQWSMPA